VKRFAQKHEKAVTGIAAPALAKLVQYGWPGNVRELENCIERAVAMALHDHLVLEDLPERVRASRSTEAPSLLPPTLDELVSMDVLKRRYMRHVLGFVHGNKSHAARILGFDRRALYRKLDGGPEDDAARRGMGAGPASSPPGAADLEALEESGTPESPPPVRTSEPPDASSSIGHHSILVVEDDPDALETVQVLLEARGYRVATATGVAEAMRTRDVDVVLTDLHLLDGSGRDLVGRFGRAPVLVMTGDVPGCDGAGFSRLLVKPLTLAVLTHALASALAPTAPS
jgi:DNA-binding NtrC family response regulator